MDVHSGMLARRRYARAYLALLVAHNGGIALFFLGVAVATSGQLIAGPFVVVGLAVLASGFVSMVSSVLGVAARSFAIFRRGAHGRGLVAFSGLTNSLMTGFFVAEAAEAAALEECAINRLLRRLLVTDIASLATALLAFVGYWLLR